MRNLILIAAVTTLAAARPELYKEKEDFQYSRSSSDEGTKSGYYDAQRGNMGGNYERAHNMDNLAQHQMSGLVRQVEGELGDGSKTRTGSVYSAANSRGIYGSGTYDIGNLQGRNFEENGAYGEQQSHSSLSNSAYRQRLSSNSHRHSNSYSRHDSSQQSEQDIESSRMQNSHNTYERSESDRYGHSSGYRNNGNANKVYEQGNSAAYGQSSNYRTSHIENANAAHEQQESDAYGQSSDYRYYPQNRLINTTPMRIMIRPGTKVILPVASETYDGSHTASSYDDSKTRSEAEELASGSQQKSHRYPNNNKHYESSYSYHKQWEKHSNPEPTHFPTESPYSKSSEISDASKGSQKSNYQYRASDTDSRDSSRYASNVQSAKSSESRHDSDYNSQYHQSASSNTKSNAYTHSGSNHLVDDAELLKNIHTNSRPKSYQSSYSYHKSWERQGDPYVIPVPNSGTDGQISERLSAISSPRESHSSHQYGSHHKEAHQSYTSGTALDCNCEEDEHSRVARSYNSNPEQFYSYQQHRNVNDDQEQDYQSQRNNLENLGQQAQRNIWDQTDNFGQQSQNGWNQLEDLRQQSHNKFDKTEDLGQQAQNRWDNIEDLGQQTQNRWDKIENLGQQAQNRWDKLEDLGQQTENKWGKIEDLGQQTENKWGKINDQEQQQAYQHHNFEQLEQHHQRNIDQPQEIWDKLENIGVHKDKNIDNFGQLIENQHSIEIHNNTSADNPKNTYEQFPTYFSESIPQNFNHSPQLMENHKSNEYQPHTSIWDKLDSFEKKHNGDKIEETSVSNTERNTENFKQSTSIKPIWELLQDNLSNISRDAVLDNKSNKNGTNAFSSTQDTLQIINVLNKSDTFTHNIRPKNQKTQFIITSSTTMKTNQYLLATQANDSGRGDIGSEELIDAEMTTTENIDVINETPEYPEEIESVTTENNSITQNTYDEALKSDRNLDYQLNSIELKQELEQKEHLHTNENFNNKYNERPDIGKENINLSDQNITQNIRTDQQNKNKTEQNRQQTNYFIEKENTKVQNNVQEFNLQQDSINFNQGNIEQQFDFGQHSDKFNEQNLEQFDIGQQNDNFDQQNTNQEFDFGHHKEKFKQENIDQFDVGQQNDNFDQQNIDQQFDLGLDRWKFNQQNIAQFDVGQKNENFDQQNIEQQFDFGQDRGKSEQHNIEHIDVGQQNEKFAQRNIEQQFDFGQHSGKFNDVNNEQFDVDQQNVEQMSDFEQQNEAHMAQQFDFEKEYLNQRNGHNLLQNNISNQQKKTMFEFDQQSEQNIAQQFESGKHIENPQNLEQTNIVQQSENLEPIITYTVNNNHHLNLQGRNSDYIYSQPMIQENSRQHETQIADIYNPKYYSLETLNNKDIEKPAYVENITNVMSSTVAPTTEKTGFWASVGSKFTRAKEKIGSWFKRS
ncbi:uncharacterized protein DDB_G0283357-like [Achroia grisella]|uniref:uncharacterized protein DDB_G0283357-like n=1 Tax=Achroia grisella TaxID=688607 RepID=UPI0027D2C74D|nr:uncharacterized protein DDB_G0283357-like [Achroia grisella]